MAQRRCSTIGISYLDDVAEVSQQHQAWIVVYAICPCCDLYALGMDLETGYPFTEVDG